jgi:hypothetical protein
MVNSCPYDPASSAQLPGRAGNAVSEVLLRHGGMRAIPAPGHTEDPAASSTAPITTASG